MNNIRIIKTGINVSKILKQLEQYSEDWVSQISPDGSEEVSKGALQLVMAAVTRTNTHAGYSEISMPTPAYNHHTEIIRFLKRNFKKFDRCGFLSLPPGGTVDQHIDEGTYYLTRDRYHLSIQGTYRYTVGGESVIVEPGTLLWFNNKSMHGAENIGNDVRIAFVFDVPHSKNNP